MTSAVFPPDSEDYQNASGAQIRAADPQSSAWVAANAGSGKTKVLIDRVARLLLNKASPDSILCVTYTKAAASEMLSRLFERLGAWSVMPSDELRTKLAELEQRPPAFYDDEALAAARSLFARALETPGGLRIETIHAFCSRILRRFPLEAGVAPGFSEIEEGDAERLWRQACQQVLLRGDIAPDVLEYVSKQAGHGGIIGALNSIRHIASEVLSFSAQHHHRPDVIQAALRRALKAPETSHNDLLTEAMGPAFPGEPLRALLPLLRGGAKTDIQTADRLETALNATTPEQRWDAYRAIFTTQKGWRANNPYTKKTSEQGQLAELFQIKDGEGLEVRRIKDLDDQLARRAAFDRSNALLKIAIPTLHAYAREKDTHAALDFDDLIQHTRDLLTRAHAAEWVLYKLDGGLTHVLLDEAQDTSPDQWELLNALTAEFFAGTGIERRITPRTQFVVGDEKQSIFSFQGADPQRFLDERREFEARARTATGDAVLPDMAMSFRSSPEILQFVDKTFEMAAMDGPPFTLDPESAGDLPRHTARRANQAGRVELWPIEAPQAPDLADPWDAPLDHMGESHPKTQLAKQVAKEAARILSAGEMVWEEQADRSWQLRPAHAGDILILVQNRAGGLFDALINALKAEGLPVAGADRLILADHIGVQDCLNLMRFALLPSDDLTVAEILRGPFCALTQDDQHLFPLAYRRGNQSLWERLQASDDPAHKAAAAFLKGVQADRNKPAYEFLMDQLNRADGTGATGWDKLIGRLGAPALEPIRALITKALSQDAHQPASLEMFVADMDHDRSQIKRDLAAAGRDIRIMTAHGAKGLQAPIVMLPDTTRRPKDRAGELFLVDKAPIWSRRADTDTPELTIARDTSKARMLAEHRRLLYVALTRAQDRLMIFGHWHGTRPKDGETKSGFADTSWYALCHEAMSTLSDGSAGEHRTYGTEPRCADTPHSEEEALVPATPAWLNTPLEEKQQHPQIISPSSLMKDNQAVLSPFSDERLKRLKRGRLIHALLQRLPDIDTSKRAAAGMHFLEQDLTLTDPERREMLSAAMGVLDGPEFAHLFAAGGRAEAAIVGSIPELPERYIVNGRVDRLIITERDILVVDFKTDRPPPENAADVSPAYLAQMGAYASILRQAWPGRNIRAALIWTDGPRLMPLANDLIEKALARSTKAD